MNNIEIAVRINVRFGCRCWRDHHDPSAGLPCIPLLKTRHKEFFQVFRAADLPSSLVVAPVDLAFSSGTAHIPVAQRVSVALPAPPPLLVDGFLPPASGWTCRPRS